MLLQKKRYHSGPCLMDQGHHRFATAHELAHFFLHEEAD